MTGPVIVLKRRLSSRASSGFVAWISPKAIAKRLNTEGYPRPEGYFRSPSIDSRPRPPRNRHPEQPRSTSGRASGTGRSTIKDPDNRQACSAAEAASEWIIKDVPELSILEADLWQQAKTRQGRPATVKQASSALDAPIYLFSGLTKCAVCGGGLQPVEPRRCCAASTTRSATPVRTPRTITRQELEARVLRGDAERDSSMTVSAFAEFCEGFTEELNRLRMEQRARLAATKRELAAFSGTIERVIDCSQGSGIPSVELDEMNARSRGRRRSRKRGMEASLRRSCIPHMADVYRAKVSSWRRRSSTTTRTQRESARQALRGFITES